MDPQQKVEASYDCIGEQYLRTKHVNAAATLPALEKLAHDLPARGKALDLGCGAGVPITQWLAQRFAVTGVDISARQLELARQHVPGVTLVKADMSTIDFPPGSFAVVVAFHAIIHVPRVEQPPLVSRIHRWLRPGGRFLATWAVSAWEGEEENWEGWGAPMWWSHYDAGTNLALLRDAGFLIQSAETHTSDGESWLWILAGA